MYLIVENIERIPASKIEKGEDYIKVYDESDNVSRVFQGIPDFSKFSVEGGEFTPAEPDLGINGEVLYSNSSGTSGTVTLSDSAANYDYLVIYFRNYNDRFSSIKIYSPNEKATALELNDHNSSQGWFSRGCIATISGSTNSIIEVSSYTSEAKRNEEKNAEKGEDINVFIYTKFIDTEYNKNLNVDSAYAYIKSLPIFEDAIDV